MLVEKNKSLNRKTNVARHQNEVKPVFSLLRTVLTTTGDRVGSVFRKLAMGALKV